jgi:hypothetical protein
VAFSGLRRLGVDLQRRRPPCYKSCLSSMSPDFKPVPEALFLSPSGDPRVSTSLPYLQPTNTTAFYNTSTVSSSNNAKFTLHPSTPPSLHYQISPNPNEVHRLPRSRTQRASLPRPKGLRYNTKIPAKYVPSISIPSLASSSLQPLTFLLARPPATSTLVPLHILHRMQLRVVRQGSLL